MALVLTKAALALKKNESNVEVVRFQSYKPKQKSSANITENNILTKEANRKDLDLDLKKIRHEVVKFGMSGFDSTKKQEAKIALAVSLGAKPPKRKNVNYKELMQKRKEQKEKMDQEKQYMLLKSKISSKTKKKNPGNDVGHLLSSYGKVKNKEILKDNSSEKKKKKK